MSWSDTRAAAPTTTKVMPKKPIATPEPASAPTAPARPARTAAVVVVTAAAARAASSAPRTTRHSWAVSRGRPRPAVEEVASLGMDLASSAAAGVLAAAPPARREQQQHPADQHHRKARQDRLGAAER